MRTFISYLLYVVIAPYQLPVRGVKGHDISGKLTVKYLRSLELYYLEL